MEELKSITDVRKTLREISESAQTHMQRYIITNQGRPQSVLLGYREYRGMKAAVELMNRPEEMTRLNTGLQQLNRGKRLTSDELKQNLSRRGAPLKGASTGESTQGRSVGGHGTAASRKGDA